MKLVRYLFITALLSQVASLTACGGDDEDGANTVDRACRTSCDKLSECMLLGGISVSNCIDLCRNNATGSEGGCQVSESKANACVAAFEGASCAELTSNAALPECDLCPSSGAGGSNSGGGGGNTSVAGSTSGGGSSTADCGDLSACCAELPSDQRSACEAVVTNGNASLCATTLSAFQMIDSCD